MTLDQLYDRANRKSYYSRSDADIWDALNDSSLKLYRRVLKEMRGYFVKWDTSLALVANTDEYSLPADLGQIIRFGEREAGETQYREILPADVNSAAFSSQQFGGLDLPASSFLYYGPYLTQAVAAGTAGQVTETYKIRLAPMPGSALQTELFYAAKFLEITGKQSSLTIPLEGHDALADLATAKLLHLNSDVLGGEFERMGETETEEFLTYIRNRQIQAAPSQEPYLGDLD